MITDPEVLACTPEVVQKLLQEVTCAMTGYDADHVLIETKADRRPQDTKPFASLWFKNAEPLRQDQGDIYIDQDAPDSEDGIQVLDNETLFTVQFNFWGRGAYSTALSVVSALQNARRFFDLWRLIGFAGIDAVQDISAVYGAQVQQRAYFNCDFYACFGRKYPVDWYKVSQWELDVPDVSYKETFKLDGVPPYGPNFPGCMPE